MTMTTCSAPAISVAVGGRPERSGAHDAVSTSAAPGSSKGSDGVVDLVDGRLVDVVEDDLRALRGEDDAERQAHVPAAADDDEVRVELAHSSSESQKAEAGSELTCEILGDGP